MMMCPIGLNSVPPAPSASRVMCGLNSVPPGDDVPHRPQHACRRVRMMCPMMCPIGLNSVPPGEG